MKREVRNNRNSRLRVVDLLSVESTVNRHNEYLAGCVDQLIRLGMHFNENQLPMINIGPPKLVNRMKRGLMAQIDDAARFYRKGIGRVSRLFETELDYLDLTPKRKALLTRSFTQRREWALKSLQAVAGEIRLNISQNAFWAQYFHQSPPVFQIPKQEQTDVIEWEDEQTHSMGGGRHPLKKTKKSVLEEGVRKNILILTFPQVDGASPTKRMEEQATITRNGKKIHVLDLPRVELGNVLLPAAPPLPPMKFFGYGKVIFVENVANNCEIIFRQIQRVRCYHWNRKDGWRVLEGTQNTDGQPTKDEPGDRGEFPKKRLPGGEWLTADFPSFGAGLPKCRVVFQEKKFRMWIIEKCGNQLTVLGYVKWGFNMLLHAAGGGNFTRIDDTSTIRPPPQNGGWPSPLNAPDRVEWGDPDPTSPEGTEFKALYPDSGL